MGWWGQWDPWGQWDTGNSSCWPLSGQLVPFSGLERGKKPCMVWAGGEGSSAGTGSGLGRDMGRVQGALQAGHRQGTGRVQAGYRQQCRQRYEQRCRQSRVSSAGKVQAEMQAGSGVQPTVHPRLSVFFPASSGGSRCSAVAKPCPAASPGAVSPQLHHVQPPFSPHPT